MIQIGTLSPCIFCSEGILCYFGWLMKRMPTARTHTFIRARVCAGMRARVCMNVRVCVWGGGRGCVCMCVCLCVCVRACVCVWGGGGGARARTRALADVFRCVNIDHSEYLLLVSVQTSDALKNSVGFHFNRTARDTTYIIIKSNWYIQLIHLDITNMALSK